MRTKKEETFLRLCEEGDVEALEDMLSKGKVKSFKLSVLLEGVEKASAKHQFSTFDYLLSIPLIRNNVTANGNALFSKIMKNFNTDAALQLLRIPAVMEHVLKSKLDPEILFTAIRKGDVKILKQLMSHSKLDATTPYLIMLKTAAASNNMEVLRLLMQYKNVRQAAIDNAHSVLKECFYYEEALRYFLNIPEISAHAADDYNQLLNLTILIGSKQSIKAVCAIPSVRKFLATDSDSYTLLTAIQRNRLEAVRVLLNMPEVKTRALQDDNMMNLLIYNDQLLANLLDMPIVLGAALDYKYNGYDLMYWNVIYGNTQTLSRLLQNPEALRQAEALVTGENMNILHLAAQYKQTEALLILLQNKKFRDKVAEKDIYGRTALDIALSNGLDEVVEKLYPEMAEELKQSSISKNQPDTKDQATINEKLSNYLDSQGLQGKLALDYEGNCGGWGFMFLTWPLPKFRQMLDFLAKTDLSDIDAAEVAFQNCPLYADYANSKPDTSTRKNVEIFLDHVISDLAFFQHSSANVEKLNLSIWKEWAKSTYTDNHITLFNLLQSKGDGRVIKKLFDLPFSLMDIAQLTEHLEFLRRWPHACIDVAIITAAGPHAMGLRIGEQGSFIYFDSNHLYETEFTSTKALAEHIIKFAADKFNQPGTEMFPISFGGFKVYDSPAVVPDKEMPLPGRPYTYSPNQWNPLHYAVLDNAPERIEDILAQHPEYLSQPDVNGNTPVELAFKLKKEEVVLNLISEASRALIPYNWEYISADILGSANLKIYEAILDNGAKLQDIDSLLFTAIHNAIEKKDNQGSALLRRILSDESYPLAKYVHTFYPLTETEWTVIRETLRSKNYPLDKIDDNGYTLLETLINREVPSDILIDLIKHTTVLEKVLRVVLDGPLNLPADVLTALLKHPDFSKNPVYGDILLRRAYTHNNIDMVKTLLKAGALISKDLYPVLQGATKNDPDLAALLAERVPKRNEKVLFSPGIYKKPVQKSRAKPTLKGPRTI